jgi:hypothetical protein
MKSQAAKSDPTWPEIAGGPARHQKAATAAVFPVVVEHGERCFGVSIDQRWLRGSRGELTFFDSIAAASRFLQLVKMPVHGLIFAPPQALELGRTQAVQCFSLSRQGLASCCRCQLGQSNHAREAREYARQDECW